MRRAVAAVVLPVLALTGACTGGDPPTGRSPGSQAGTFTNPVYTGNFPDPGVLRVDGTWYAYGSNDAHANVPLMTSTDLVGWTVYGDVLPELGRWASRGHTWAPEVSVTADGRYLLYYTARSSRPDRQCVGVAVATAPVGPFVDDASGPLVCQTGEGGSIDASPYRAADGSTWLYWKNDGNAIGRTTYVYGRRLTADGRALTGPEVRLASNDTPWEGNVVEAPQMVAHEGRHYLFYSANAFDSDAYAVGYAVCDSPLGPCRDAAENPVLRSSAAAAGPGHSFLVTVPGGGTWLLYHAWPPGAVGSVSPGRQLWLDRVAWTDGRPVVHAPTGTAQPVPG